MALSDTTKRQLKSLVIALRRALEEDLGKQLKRLGVDPAKAEAVPVAGLSYLTDEERNARAVLDAVLAKEQAMTGSFADAVTAVRREAAYTHLNRLVGLKCLELRGHLRIEGEPMEAVSCRAEFGGRPKWLWTLRDRENRYRHGEDAEELLWREGLIEACRAVAAEVSVLFDPADPYAQVWPSHKVLREVIDKLNQLPEDAFRADELLGWVYQYFQSEEKDRVFAEVRTKKKKIAWQDIVPVTQLYTERYMVDFLLQNSIGARWMEMYPDSQAKGAWPYYVTPATPHTRPPKPLKDWTILDPCVGSAHFLLVAFDLLVQLYTEERTLAAAGRVPADWPVAEGEVARTILERNLYGIDIDPRAIQIAALALDLKAKEHGRGVIAEPAVPANAPVPKPPIANLVVADAVLTRGTAYEELLAQYQNDAPAREAIEAIWHALEHVRDLGSLVRVEEEVASAVRKAKAKEDRHSPLLSSAKDWGLYKLTLLKRLKAAFAAEACSSDVSKRLLGTEGTKGVGLLDLLSRRYDVVTTNPPYMGSKNMGPMLKDFVARWYTPGKRDLYAAFILRCRELASPDGHVAMVTQQSWMFLRSFSELRAAAPEEIAKMKLPFRGLLHDATLDTLAHLGAGAFAEVSGEVVQVALLTLRCIEAAPEHRMTAFRLIGPRSPEEKASLLRSAIAGQLASLVFRPPQARFVALPNASISYWAPEALLVPLTMRRRPEVRFIVSEGLGTRYDARFVRFFWEVSNPQRWKVYSKGGGYGRWFGHDAWSVEWEDNGARVKSYVSENYAPEKFTLLIRNEARFGTARLVYSTAARGSLGAREIVGAIPGDKGPGIFVNAIDHAAAASFFNCRASSYLLRGLTAGGLNFNGFYVGLLPLWLVEHPNETLLGAARTCIALKRAVVATDPTERSFNPSTFRAVASVEGK